MITVIPDLEPDLGNLTEDLNLSAGDKSEGEILHDRMLCVFLCGDNIVIYIMCIQERRVEKKNTKLAFRHEEASQRKQKISTATNLQGHKIL